MNIDIASIDMVSEVNMVSPWSLLPWEAWSRGCGVLAGGGVQAGKEKGKGLDLGLAAGTWLGTIPRARGRKRLGQCHVGSCGLARSCSGVAGQDPCSQNPPLTLTHLLESLVGPLSVTQGRMAGRGSFVGGRMEVRQMLHVVVVSGRKLYGLGGVF